MSYKAQKAWNYSALFYVKRLYSTEITRKIFIKISTKRQHILNLLSNNNNDHGLLSGYVDGLETDADKERLKTILKELYVEAHDYEET